MKSLAILQPSIEIYRNDFYHKLSKIYNLELFAKYKNSDLDKNIKFNKTIIIKTNFFEFEIFNYLKLFQSDLIILTGNLKILSNIIIILINLFYKKKIYYLNHVLSKKHSNLKFIFFKIITKLISGVITYTKTEQRFLKRYYRIKKSFYLSNGLKTVDPKLVNLNKSNYPFSIIFIGKISPKVNLDTFLERLIKFNSKCNLNIVTTTKSIKIIERKLNYLKEKNNLITVKLFLDKFDNSSLINIFNSSHFMIYPGSVGLSLIHSFNFGVPVILPFGKYYHMPEIEAFKNGHNGFYYEDTSDNFIRTLHKCLNIYMLDDYKRLSNNSLDTVRFNYNTENMVNNLIYFLKT